MKKRFAGCLAACLALAWTAVAGAAEPQPTIDNFGVVVAVPVPGGATLYFEAGRWYRQADGRWQGAGSPEGPWLLVPTGELPPLFLDLPQLKESLPALPPPPLPQP
jgi:hypothetical protein